MSTAVGTGFVPPPYPYDRLAELVQVAGRFDGGAVDLSVGTPCDDPPSVVVAALAGSAGSASVRGYPPSIGSPDLRAAAVGWLQRRLEVTVEPHQVAACVGTKELVASVPGHLHLRSPDRDTVLYPAVSYPTYAMGATLAGCRAVAVPVDDDWRLDLSTVAPSDAERALCLWTNTPGNPAGGLDDLAAVAAWGREHGVPIFSDECYVEFTWEGPPVGSVGLPGQTVLSTGTEGVVAVHSLSKRSNLAGARAGFYAGDADLVHYLGEVRKHAGLMVPGPVQAAAVAALADDTHVVAQRERYRHRLALLVRVLAALGVEATLPGGSFYLWVAAPAGTDGWSLATRLAHEVGAVVSPGEFYGPAGSGFARVAAVQPDARIELLAQRAGVA